MTFKYPTYTKYNNDDYYYIPLIRNEFGMVDISSGAKIYKAKMIGKKYSNNKVINYIIVVKNNPIYTNVSDQELFLIKNKINLN